MTPAEIITRAQGMGVVLEPGPYGSLHYRTQAGPIPVWLGSLIRTHKPAILDALAKATPTPAPQADSAVEATTGRPADVYQVRTDPSAQWFTCIVADDPVTGGRRTLAELQAEHRSRWGSQCETRAIGVKP